MCNGACVRPADIPAQDGPGRRGHDHRENGEPVRIGQLQRNVEKSAADLPIAHQAQGRRARPPRLERTISTSNVATSGRARCSRRRRGRTGRSCAIASTSSSDSSAPKAICADAELATEHNQIAESSDCEKRRHTSGAISHGAACSRAMHDANVDLRRMQRLRCRLRYDITGPAPAVSARHSRIRNAGGAASMTATVAWCGR